MSNFAFSLVRLNHATNYLTGIRNGVFSRRDKILAGGDDGTIHETTQKGLRTAPMARFDTVAVHTLAGLLNGSSELPMKALDGTNGLEMVGAKISTAGPGYDASAVHARRKGARGQLYLSGLSYSPGDILEASCEAFFFAAAGGTDPIVSDTIATPTTPVNTEQLVLTSLVCGGLTITRLASFNVAVTHQCENNDEEICYDTGLPHPVGLKQAGIGGNASVVGTIDIGDLTGAVTTSGSCVAIFKKLAHNDIGVGTDTVTVTLSNALIREEEVQGKPGRRRLIIRPTWDGATRPLSVVAS